MEKKFNRFLSIVLALVMSSSTALTVSSETVSVESPDEPAVIEWTEETQTDEFEIRSDVVGEENEEKDKKEDVSSDSKPDKDKAEQAKPEAKAEKAAAPEAKAEKAAVAPSGANGNENAEGTCGNLTWRYDADTTTLTISGEGEMVKVERHNGWVISYVCAWRDYSSYISNIIIENGVTSVCDNAFDGWYGGYDKLVSVSLPDSVTSIGSSAFRGCKNLTNITIPDSVTSIGNSAFEECKNLTNITIPDSVTSIGNCAFQKCEKLTSITIPNSVTKLNTCVFDGCSSLAEVTLPSSLTEIPSYAFRDCSTLSHIEFPDSLTSIGDNAFRYCSSLQNVLFPDSLVTIGDYAFASCYSFTKVVIPDSVTTIGEGSFGAFWSGKGKISEFVIGNSVTSIGDWAFSGSKITTIDLPESLTYLSGFAGCYSLTSIEIPDTVKTIGSSAFSHCYGLTDILIPDSVTSIKDRAFESCNGLTSITIPDSVESIDQYCFCCSRKLNSVTLSNSLTSVGYYVFTGCDALTSIVIPDSLKTVGYGMFSGCTKLTSVTIPDSITTIEKYAFEDCKLLAHIDLPNSITTIGAGAFSGCSALENIELPDSLTTIEGSAFEYTGLKTITVPDSVTKLSSYVFESNYSLSSAKLPSGIKAIPEGTFKGCTSLKSYDIPKTVTKIGTNAFQSTAIRTIDLPDGLTEIGFGVFSYCKSLEEVSIPKSVTKIETYAFQNCKALKTILIPDSVTSFGSYVFQDCNDLTIYCTPGSAALEYANANSINAELISVSEYNGTLTLNIGEQYKDAKIKVVSHDQFGKDKIEVVKLIDKTPVTFYGLDSTMTYKAEVYNDIGTVFGTFDNITLTDKFADITFSDLKEICDISVSVKDENGSDVTDLCNIKWFTEGGKYICAGAKISNAGKGDVYKYTVDFKSSLLRDNYVLPGEQTVTAGSSSVECVLAAYPTVYFTGKVTDENGKAIAHAGVSLAQTLSSDNVKTVSGSTDNNGSFMIYAKNMPTKLIVKKKGYEVFTEQLEALSEDEKNITINRVETAEVKLTVTTQELDKEAAETNSIGDMNFVLKNETTGKEINGFTAAPTALSLPLNEVSEGDEITVKVTSDGYESASASFVYGTDEAVSLSLVKRGKIVINRVGNNMKLDMAVIFNGSGKYVSTVTMKKAKASSDNLPADNYTVVMMNKNDRYYSPASLKEFNSYGLENGVDYTKAEVTVENAKTTTLDNISVPVLDESKTSYLDLNESSITVNKTSLPLSQYFVFKVNYALDPAVTGLTNTSVVLSVPEELEAKANCAAIDGKTADFTLNDGEMIIPVTKKSGSVVVAFKAMNSCDFCTVTAKFSFKANEKETSEAIGSVNCTVESFDYYLAETVNTTEVYSSGTTFANSSVEYYDNDILVGTTKTNASGSYEITFELNNPYKRSSHTIYALVTTPFGDVYKSAVKDLEYISDGAVANKLDVLYHGKSFAVNFNRSQTDNLYYSFVPRDPTFTFELDVSGGASNVISANVVTKTSSGEYIRVPLTLDEKTGKLIGSYDYKTENRPAAISVELLTEVSMKFDRAEVKEAVSRYNDYFSEMDAISDGVLELYDSIDDWKKTTITEDELIDFLNELGFDKSAYSNVDLKKIISEETTAAINEIEEEKAEEYRAREKEIKKLLNNAQKPYDDYCNCITIDYMVCDQLDIGITAEQLIAQGYTPVETYDSDQTIFISTNENTEYSFIDLSNNAAIRFESSDSHKNSKNALNPSGSNTSITASGDGDCGCCSNPDFGNGFIKNMDEKLGPILEEINKVVETLAALTEVANNNLKDIIKENRYQQAKLGAQINRYTSQQKELAATVSKTSVALQSSLIVAATKIKVRLSILAKQTSFLKDISKYLSGLDFLFKQFDYCMVANDLLNYLDQLMDLYKAAKTICPCLGENQEEAKILLLEASIYWYKSVRGYIADYAVGYAASKSKNPYLILGYVISHTYGTAAVSATEIFDSTQKYHDTVQKYAEPVEYSKRMADKKIEEINNLSSQYCKCHQKDPNNNIPLRSGVDPSGYICETVPSNRIEGVTATLFYSDSSTGENATLWDASQYEQENPLLSDENGHYEWYVPEGWWQVKFEKAGYETTYSDWVPVLPIQTEVNVEMKSLYAPTVKNLNVFTDSVDITFSHYVEVESITGENITIEMGGNNVSGTIVPLNEEAGFSNSNVLYASKFRFIPDQTLSGDVTVNVEKIKASNGLYMDTPYSETKTAEEKIESVNVPENITMKYDASTDVEITLLPASAGANKTISVRSSSDKLLSVENNTVVTDENGKATVKITGHMPAHAELTFTVDGYDISAVTNVELSTNDPVDELAAALTITPEGSACFGKIVETKISINGGTAPYMYKLEMIDDNGESETLYTHHFHELSDDDSSMMFNKMCNKAGHFTFKATVTDAAGQVSTDTKEINVHQASITDITPDKTSAFVGDTIVFTPSTMHLSPDMAQYCKYKYTVTKDGVSTEFLYPEKSSLSFIPTKSGEYTIALTIADVLGNTIAEKTITYTVDDIAVDDVTIYYKGYANPNIHYRTAGGTWTTVPGVAMQQTDEIEGFTHKYTIALDGAEYAEVCFNDGNGNWDSRNGANYRFTKGNFTFANGVITPIEKPDFSASLALSDEIVPVNNSVTLTASTANGTEPYTYTFAYTRLGERNEIVTDNSSAICEFTPTEEGTYQIEVTAADADGNTATAVKTLTVKAPVITAVNTNVDSAYVGQSVQLSMDTQNSFDGITASFTVRNADTNELVAELSGNTAAWTPDSVGTYVITAQLSFKGAIVAENSTAFTVEEAPVPENTITIYYKGYANPNIHYQVGTGTWTDVPGVTMTPTNEVAGYTHKYTIDLGDADYANVCFNDGHNNWDSRNGANYRFTKGTYKFSNGTITAM